jgi:adenylate cyclase class IV
MENTLMKRVIFENPLNKEKSYLRVRNEWKEITCTYKELSDWKLDINSVKEIETIVWDFDSIVEIFKVIWLRQKSYQETYRETWAIWEKVFFMLDEWPWLKPFIEIEWESEEIVREFSKKLWFNFEKDWLFWAVDEIYLAEAWIPKKVINNLEIITFENPPKK